MRSAARSNGASEPRLKTLQIYLSDLKELLQGRQFGPARVCLKEVSPIDLADGWEHFAPDERTALFRLLPRQRAIQLFEELDPPQQVELLDSLKQPDAERLLEDIDPSEAGRMIREMPQPIVARLIGIMKKGGQESVQKYLQFPPKTVGALMRGRFVTLEPKWNAKQAIERIQLSTRLRRIEETHLDTLMAVENGRLSGVVGLKALVVAPRDMAVRELMDPSPITLRPQMDQEEAVKLFTRYKLKSAPVLADDGHLMGVVVYRDIFEVAAQEVEEDFAKMAGTQVGERRRTAYEIARARLPWLLATCGGGLLVSTIIRHYEPTLSRVVALAAFSPLIAGMGGNVGSQTATVMVRAIATGEINPREELPTIAKEMSVGVMLGLFYALLIGTAAHVFYGERYGWHFATVIASAMLVSMTVAATMGAAQPLIFKRLGIDPATATAPFITTSTDLLSNVVYFWLATRWL